MSKLVRCTLGDIGKVKMCKRVLKNQTSESGDIPFYKISTFGGEPSTFISRELFDTYKKEYSYPKKGDVLLSAAGTLGKKIVFNGEKAYFQDSNIVWLENDESKVLNKYLYYFYDVIKWKKTSGSTIDRLYNENILGAEIYYPDMATQKQIVNTLSLLDSKIENNNKIISELESMAKTIYDYWFLQFEFPNENGKPYKSSGGKMVWNEELKREIPEGWGVTNVGNITTCLDSKRVPLSSKDRESMKGPYPYYGATSEMDSVNEYLFDGDYVLLAEDGSVMDDNGFPILQRTSGKVWVNNHAHVLQPKKPYGCKLLMFILKNIPVSMIKTGSIQMKVNQENLNAFKVLNIPENLIEKANSILNPIDAKIIMLKQENRELASLRDFLLPMLMNGQVTFKEDE